MKLSTNEENDLMRAGTRAALNGVGAFICPYMDDDLRFAAWIKGYELGELRLTGKKNRKDPIEEAEGFWADVRPIER